MIEVLQEQSAFLMQQNKELIEVVKVLGGKVGRRLYAGFKVCCAGLTKGVSSRGQKEKRKEFKRVHAGR